uniref:Uncharacterized protein n=1 Tax=Solanum lycopersicum TaxID=4081 RepID=A0A3Q7FFD1_SOLLC
ETSIIGEKIISNDIIIFLVLIEQMSDEKVLRVLLFI